MQCPYCLDTIPALAIACKSCGHDLHLVSRLQDRVTHLEALLGANPEMAVPASGETVASVAAPRPSYRVEIALAMAMAALLPAALFDLRIGFDLPPQISLTGAILAAGAAGLLAGYRGALRKLTCFALAVLLAVLQVGVFSLAFGCVVHAYYVGLGRGTRSAGRAMLHADPAGSGSAVAWLGTSWHNAHLWYSVAIPSLLLFVLLAYIGRSRSTKFHRSPVASSLAKRFTLRRPEEEHENFQARIEAYTKTLSGLLQLAVVLVSIISGCLVIAHQASGVAATDPVVTQSAGDN